MPGTVERHSESHGNFDAVAAQMDVVDRVIDVPLAAIVPRVGSWKLAGLVEPVGVDDLARMLDSCNSTTIMSGRDYAMLLVLSRLGLRAGEVARLELDDIDWRAGELIVRGKGPTDARLPSPADVGEAIADYFCHSRPATSQSRMVFVRVQAPHHEITKGGVTQAVFAAGQRAGCGTVYAHRLRHTAANGCSQLAGRCSRSAKCSGTSDR